MAVGETHVFPGFLTPVLTQISFKSHRLLFSHASAKARGENMLERNFALTGSQTHNHQVMSLTRSPLSDLDGAKAFGKHCWNSFVFVVSWLSVHLSMLHWGFIFAIFFTMFYPSQDKNFVINPLSYFDWLVGCIGV